METASLAWSWRWGVMVAAAVAVWLYVRGWRLLRQRPALTNVTVSNGRLLLFLSATLLLLLVLISPLHTLATTLFSVHVLQHLLLVALLPCLLLVTNPAPVIVAGLPARIRTSLRRQWQGSARLRPFLQLATAPGSALMLFIAGFWVWYDPAIHQATLRYAWLHNLETAVLTVTALLYWWHILAVAPRIHRPLPSLVRVIYTIVGTWPVKIVGLVLLFTEQTVYEYPAAMQLTGLVVDDQGIGAILVWVFGGVIFSSTATLIMRQWLQQEDEKPPLSAAVWSNEETMMAPGFHRSSSD